MDRLKLLQQYEKVSPGGFLKYSDKEEDDVTNRLQRVDKKLYYLLNPETERVKPRVVPFQLQSPYDLSTSFKEDITYLSNAHDAILLE